MRKILVLTLTLIALAGISYCQDVASEVPDNVYDESFAVQPVTPEAATFHEVTYFPDRLSSGAVDITIPFYNIEFNGINITVGISYNTNGIKINNIASNVGTGWSLIGQSMITRIIKGGVRDFSHKTIQLSDTENDKYIGHQFNTLADQYLKEEIGEYCKTTPGGRTVYDGSPDLMKVNAPGLKADFFINKFIVGNEDLEPFIIDGDFFVFGDQTNTKNSITNEQVNSPNALPISVELPTGHTVIVDNDVKRYPDYDITTLTLIASNGLEYTFNLPDWGHSFNINSISSIKWKSDISSWYLTKIKDQFGREIVYEYDELENYVLSDTRNNGYYHPNDNIEEQNQRNNTTTSLRIVNSNKRLKKITFPEGEIVFKYETLREDITEGNYALSSIEISDVNTNLLKKYLLEYNYYTNTSGEKSRLFLDKIVEEGRNQTQQLCYDFTYYPGSLPNHKTFEYDMFGYYNANGASKPAEISKDHVARISMFAYLPNEGCNRSEVNFLPMNLAGYTGIVKQVSTGLDLTPDFNAMQTGMLKEVIYPTGGKMEIEYESNAFEFENIPIDAGGLRVKNQSMVKENGEKITKGYTYQSAEGFLPRFSRFDNQNGTTSSSTIKGNLVVFSDNMANLNMIDGAPVMYKRVDVTTNGAVSNNGKEIKVYSYIADELPTYFGSYPPTGVGKTGFPFIKNPLTSRRGKILESWILDKNSTIIKASFTDYTHLKYAENTINSYSRVDLAGCGYIFGTDLSYTTGDYKLTGKKSFDNLSIQESSINIPYSNFSVLENEPLFAGGIFTLQSYSYNSNNILNESVTYSSNGEELKTTLKYSNDLSDYYTDGLGEKQYNNYGQMSAKNMVSTPIEIIKFRNSEVIGASIAEYKEDNGSYLIQHVYNLNMNEPLTSFDSYIEYSETQGDVFNNLYNNPEITFDKHDLKGNVLQYHKENDIYSAQIWAYDDTYPVIKAENTTHTALESAVTASLGSYNTIDELLVSVGDLSQESQQTIWATFVSGIQQAIPGAIISFYTYDPLVGITTQTDTNGKTTFYSYDEFNRLETIKDHNQNLVKQFNYNYKNQ